MSTKVIKLFSRVQCRLGMTYSYKDILRALCVDVGITQAIKLFWEGVGDEDIG